MFDKVNLEKALIKERNVKKERNGNEILDQFKELFRTEWENDQRILSTIHEGVVSRRLPLPGALDEEKIYDIEAIRSLCIKYRLRFLSTNQFSGKIPREAFTKIKKTENKLGQTLDAFMIAAPASVFKLEDANKDPLLFAPLEDGRFYLLHQWGSDMSWYRRIINWPLTSPLTLISTILALSLFLTLVIPTHWLSTDGSFFNFMRLFALGWNVIFSLGVSSYFWFASHGKFSIHAWNSKTFN